WTVALGGLGAIAGAFFFSRRLPRLRVEARELILAQGLAGGEPAGNMTGRALEVRQDVSRAEPSHYE
ncbi:MAG: hypothetical protein WBL99_08060, partial [Candidatus Acidiferrales bacterium]